MQIYERIRNLREDNDLRQRQVAKELQCSQRVYSNYECGQVNLPLGALIKLAEFYGTSTDYLLNLTDEKTPHPRKRQ